VKRDLDAHTTEILERGYTVLERTHSDEVVETFREKLSSLYDAQRKPALYAKRSERLTPEIEISPTGFVIFKLLKLFPELTPILLAPDAVDVARRVLGRDMHIELTGAVISDSARPFFGWHNHIGGIDVEDYRARSSWPRFEQSERLIVVLYLDDIDQPNGQILTLPRRVTDPTEAPFDALLTSWPGQARLTFPRGSTLIFEQSNWHAVEPKLTPGLRMFVGSYFTAARAPKTDQIDESLANCRGRSELFDSVLRR
jgi:hypothetical protein